MTLTESNNLGRGTKAPDFELLNTVTEKKNTLSALKGKNGTAIFFICNHCPFVMHINEELVKMANEYQPKGIGYIAVSSNDIESYPQDGPQHMKKVAEKLNYPFPYLYDADQAVARKYNASCTPDVYLFDADLKGVYRGQLDDSRPGNNIPVTGKDFRQAMDFLLNNEVNTNPQKPSIGCNIKWK